MTLTPPAFVRPLACALTLLGAPAAQQATAVTPESPAPNAAPNAPVLAEEEALRTTAIALIESGDYTAAREHLDGLLLVRELEGARRCLANGDPAEALVFVDRALELAPRHREARWLKAESSLRLAEAGIARGSAATLIEGSLQDAVEFFASSAKEDPRATFGASRAALLLGRSDDALRWARQGRTLLFENPELERRADDTRAETEPHRVVAEAFFRAYVEAKRNASEAGEEPDEATRESVRRLFVEAEAALGHLLGRHSDDPWAWRTLADLFEWEERYDGAERKLLAGLDRAPGDAGLLHRLARVTRLGRGREAVIENFARFVSRNPSLPLGHWLLAVERFDLGLDRMAPPEGTPSYDSELFTLAEAGFQRCRELAPWQSSQCLGYEAVCRSARGWCAFFGDDDLAGARRAFLSMNELFEGAITWSLEGRLQSGVLGLAFVGDQHMNRGEYEAAGEAFELAHRYDPEDPIWANNAGFLLRDAAVNLELEGRRLARAAQGQREEPAGMEELRALADVPPELVDTERERTRFAAAANERMEHARALMERSWIAYRDAAALDHENVRTVNDAALVLVYYLHHSLDEARRLLMHGAELGPPQLEALKARMADPDLSEEEYADLETELYDLEEAVGDVYQNLGVLDWVHHRDGAAALPWLERSVAMGPDPRPMLSNILIPQVRGEREPIEGEYFDLKRWARPVVLDPAIEEAARVEAAESGEESP